MIKNNKLDIKTKKIVFIASYMKSGNTWARSIICSLLNNGNFQLKDLKKIKLFSQEAYFSKLPNIKFQKNGNLDFNFVSNNWINVQKIINKTSNNDVKFFKTHSVHGIINGNYFTNEKVCKGFVYLIRDPRDIAISLSKHMNISIDNAIDIILYKNDFVTNVYKINEPVCTWKNNVNSWLSFNTVPRLIIKYEDMINNNKKIINKILNFLKLIFNNQISITEKVINETIKQTNFNNLKKLEKINGFDEATNNNFFRKGASNQWKKILTIKQQKIIEDELSLPLQKLGYKKKA